jgi:hypothetical protein
MMMPTVNALAPSFRPKIDTVTRIEAKAA